MGAEPIRLKTGDGPAARRDRHSRLTSLTSAPSMKNSASANACSALTHCAIVTGRRALVPERCCPQESIPLSQTAVPLLQQGR